MHFNIQLLINWLVFLTASIILVLLWLQKFDVERKTIDETVRDATVLIRVANFVLTSEILLVVSTFYGGITWYIIQKKSIEVKHIDVWSFYDGGSTFLPTVKAFISSKYLSFKMLSMTAFSIMLCSYFLDIYYINSIAYMSIEKCEVRNTTIDIMSDSVDKNKDLDRYSEIYTVGSRIGLLPYSEIEYSNRYLVPALGNTTYIQNYTTIVYNVSVQCKDAPMKINNSSYTPNSKAVNAKGYNGTYTELLDGVHVNETNVLITQDNGILPWDTTTSNFFISVVGSRDKIQSVNLTPFQFGQYDVVTAHCTCKVTYELIDRIYGWDLNTSFVKNAEYLANKAPDLPVDVYQAYQKVMGYLHGWLMVNQWLMVVRLHQFSFQISVCLMLKERSQC